MTPEEKEQIVAGMLEAEEVKRIYKIYIIKEIPFEKWVRNTVDRILKHNNLPVHEPWDKSCPYCCSTGCNHGDWTHSSAYKEGIALCYDKECPLVK